MRVLWPHKYNSLDTFLSIHIFLMRYTKSFSTTGGSRLSTVPNGVAQWGGILSNPCCIPAEKKRGNKLQKRKSYVPWIISYSCQVSFWFGFSFFWALAIGMVHNSAPVFNSGATVYTHHLPSAHAVLHVKSSKFWIVAGRTGSTASRFGSNASLWLPFASAGSIETPLGRTTAVYSDGFLEWPLCHAWSFLHAYANTRRGFVCLYLRYTFSYLSVLLSATEGLLSFARIALNT